MFAYPPPSGLGPRTLEYTEGQPIPPGYRVRTRSRRGLAIAGAATFGGPYLVSLLVGATLVADGDKNSGRYAPLMIPIVGPFIATSTLSSQGAGTFWLVVDGIAQVGGVGLFVAGLAMDEKALVRGDVEARSSIVPSVLVGPSSASARWRF
jgi:hypothetical protein